MNSSQLYSYDTILANTGGDDGVAKQVVQLHIDLSSSDMQKMNQAVQESNLEDIRKLAHKSKSGFMILGADQLYDLATDLEKAAKENAPEVKSLFNEFENLNALLLEQLKVIDK